MKKTYDEETNWLDRLRDPRLLRIEEMSQIFHRAIPTIRRQIADGSFEIEPRVRAARKPTLWSPGDVQRWLDKEPVRRGGAR